VLVDSLRGCFDAGAYDLAAVAVQALPEREQTAEVGAVLVGLDDLGKCHGREALCFMGGIRAGALVGQE